MASNAICWHSPEIVREFPFPAQFKTSLELLALADYEHKKYFKGSDIPALDLDGFEKNRTRKGNNLRTIDAFIGICNERGGKRINPRLLPVELRMNYKSDKNLDSKYLKDKLQHSCFLVKNADESVTIDLSYTLVFDVSLIHQMTRWLENIKRADSSVKPWQTLSPDGLCEYINLGKEFPYTPKKASKELATRIKITINNKNINAFEALWPEVRQYIEICNLRYQHGECQFLVSVLREAIKQLGAVPMNTEEERLMFEILEDDVSNLTRRWLP